MSPRSTLPALACLTLFAAACGTKAPGAPEAGAPAASATVTASVEAPAPPPPASATATAAASAAPEPPPAASASAAAPAGPVPNVKVQNIGMHIGGGPNDAPTKAPIHKSVAPHFDEMKRCFAMVDDQKKGGDFGIDLRIDKAGGKAKLSHPRTALKGAGFSDCMVKVFEGVDFLKPKGGDTMVSYSVRFTP